MKSHLNILHLKFFCDAVVYNSISEAAKMNFVTQSAVSQGISKLESILCKELLIHARQKFQLTDEGKIVFEEARNVFKSIDNIYEKIGQTEETITGVLKFSTTKSLGMSFIAPSYRKIKNCLPEVQMSVRLGGLNFIRNSIKHGEVEFGVVVYDQDFKQFAKHPIKKGIFNLYQSINTQKSCHNEDILVNYYKGSYVEELRSHIDQHSNLKIKAELSGWEVIARFTELDIGIGFFPNYIMENNRYPNIEIHPLKLPLFEYEICVIYNKGEKLSRVARVFIEQFSLDCP